MKFFLSQLLFTAKIIKLALFIILADRAFSIKRSCILAKKREYACLLQGAGRPQATSLRRARQTLGRFSHPKENARLRGHFLLAEKGKFPPQVCSEPTHACRFYKTRHSQIYLNRYNAAP